MEISTTHRLVPYMPSITVPSLSSSFFSYVNDKDFTNPKPSSPDDHMEASQPTTISLPSQLGRESSITFINHYIFLVLFPKEK